MSIFIRSVALAAMLAVGWPAQGDNPKNRAKQNRKADAARQAAQNEREREQREKAQELQQAAKALSKQEQEAFAGRTRNSPRPGQPIARPARPSPRPEPGSSRNSENPWDSRPPSRK